MGELLGELTNKVLDLQERVIKLESLPRKIVKDKNDFPEGYPYK